MASSSDGCAVLEPCQAAGARIITTSGAANPIGAGGCTRRIARELGLIGLRIAVVVGGRIADPALDAHGKTWSSWLLELEL